MDHALLLGFKRQKLVDVNLVRTFLQVTTLRSDIVSAVGLSILPASWQGQPISDQHSKMKLARQLQPTVYQRGLWRRLLRSFLVPLSKAPNLLLQRPLGVWTKQSHMHWGAMMWEEEIYRRDPHNSSGERNVSVHYPQHLVHSDKTPAYCTFYAATPDWYTASIPRMTALTDHTGNRIFLATSSDLQNKSIPGPAATFIE
jgi:hypothetical protein